MEPGGRQLGITAVPSHGSSLPVESEGKIVGTGGEKRSDEWDRKITSLGLLNQLDASQEPGILSGFSSHYTTFSFSRRGTLPEKRLVLFQVWVNDVGSSFFQP